MIYSISILFPREKNKAKHECGSHNISSFFLFYFSSYFFTSHYYSYALASTFLFATTSICFFFFFRTVDSSPRFLISREKIECTESRRQWITSKIHTRLIIILNNSWPEYSSFELHFVSFHLAFYSQGNLFHLLWIH